jgi:hypothetical protein
LSISYLAFGVFTEVLLSKLEPQNEIG